MWAKVGVVESCDAIAVRNATVFCFFLRRMLFLFRRTQRVCGSSSSLYHYRTCTRKYSLTDDGVYYENVSERKRSDIELHRGTARRSRDRSGCCCPSFITSSSYCSSTTPSRSLMVRSDRRASSRARTAAATVKALTCARHE